MDFLLKALANFMGNVIKGLIESVLLGVISSFQSLMKTYTTHGLVVNAHNSVLGISISIIVLFCVKQYFNTYVMETAGDPDADPMDVLVRGAQATAFASCSSWFFYSFMNFGSSFATDILGGGEEVDFTVTLLSALEGLLVNITTFGFIWLTFILVILIGIFTFYVIATIRALELALMFIILPLFCAELTYSNHERFNGIVTTIGVTGLYFSLQLLLFSLFLNQFMNTLTGITATSTMTSSTFVTIGFMISMLRAPKWLDKFMYNSGVGDTAKHGAGQIGVSVLRAGMSAFRK